MIAIIDLTDALKQGFVERDLVLEVCHHGRHLLLDLADLGCLVGTGQSEEHTTDMIEQTIALLKSQNGVLERCRIPVLHDLLDIITSLLKSHLEGGQIVRGLNLTEIRCSEGYLTLLQQGILGLSLLTGRNLHH